MEENQGKDVIGILIMNARQIDKIEIQINSLKDSISEIRSKINDVKPIDLSSQSQAIDRLDRKSDEIIKKIPPMPTLVAAGLIIIGVLGLSYNDLQNFSKPLQDASAEVQKVSKELSSSVDGLKKDFESIKDSAAALSGNIEKISGVDRALAQLLADIQRVSKAANIVPDTGLGTSGVANKQNLELDSMFDGLQGLLSPELDLLMKAHKALSAFDYQKAREYASKAKALDKDDKESVYDSLIAKSFYEEGNYREAIGAYITAIELEPQISAHHNNLGSAYFALSKKVEDASEKRSLLEKSIQSTRKALSFEKGSPEIYSNGAIVLSELGKYQDAMDLLNQWNGAESADINYQKSCVSALMGNASKSVAYLTSAINLKKETALIAAANDDFRGLRELDAFRTLLRTNLGDKLFEAVLRAWEEKGSSTEK